jgi:hypothetical protein
MSPPKIATFEEFWDYYVAQHSKPATRAVHAVGTAAAMACVAGGLLTRRGSLLLAAPLVGYGPAWLSHFFIEKNRPATFTYPMWSLKADVIMFGKMLKGQMQAEVDRVAQRKRAVPDAASGAETESMPSGPRFAPN